MHPYGRQSSPERKSNANLGSGFPGFGKIRSKDRDTAGSSIDRPGSSATGATPRPSDASSPKHARKSSVDPDRPNGTSPEPFEERAASPTPAPAGVNGTTHDTIPELIEPLAPPHSEEPRPEVLLVRVNVLYIVLTSVNSPRRTMKGSRNLRLLLMQSRKLRLRQEKLDCKSFPRALDLELYR